MAARTASREPAGARSSGTFTASFGRLLLTGVRPGSDRGQTGVRPGSDPCSTPGSSRRTGVGNLLGPVLGGPRRSWTGETQKPRHDHEGEPRPAQLGPLETDTGAEQEKPDHREGDFCTRQGAHRTGPG